MHPACSILARYTSNQSLLSALPQLCIDLYQAKLIKRMILPTAVHGEALLGKIKEAVCNDYRKLGAFAEVLCESTATAKIGNAIKRDYSKYLYYNIYQ